MTNSKHTFGPWRSERGSGDYGRNITADNGRRIVCETICSDHEANARLIASAPELLDACKTVLARTEHTNMHTTLEDMRETWELLRAAILKAEGK